MPKVRWRLFAIRHKRESSKAMKSYIYNLPGINDTIGISLVVRCGSMKEKKEQRGFSHLLEHMLISFDKFNHNKEINCSGYTDFYYTYFFFLTTHKHMKECIKYVKQIMDGKFITEDILENIREDVIKEYHAFFSKKCDSEFQWLLRRTKYIDHLAIGNFDIIKNCKIDQLKEYFYHNYISENFELIVMDNTNEQGNNILPCDNILRDHDVVHRYCTDDFEWIHYGKGRILKIYYIRVSEGEEDLLYDYLFCAIIENFIADYCSDECVKMNKILLSKVEEFFCISLSKRNIRNITNLKILINRMAESIDETYLRNFLKEYKEMYVRYLNNGYGINIVNEMKTCIKHLVFKGELIGTRELNNLILNKIDNVDIDRILKMVKKMKNNEKSFYLYKILEI